MGAPASSQYLHSSVLLSLWFCVAHWHLTIAITRNKYIYTQSWNDLYITYSDNIIYYITLKSNFIKKLYLIGNQ